MRPARGPLHERLNLLWVVCYCAVAVLGVRLLHVQVIRNVYYSQVAESNRTQIIPQTAPRGRIYDRNGGVIATNRPTFSLIYLPGEAKGPSHLSGLAAGLSKELRRDRDGLLELLKEARREGSAIHLAESLPLKTMFKLSELKTVYPGVDLIVEARRYYPKGAFAGHLLGYLGKMDKRSWRRLKGGGYRVDSWIGQSGLEKRYESVLRGVDGESRMEVNAQGHLKRKLGQIPWKPGGNVHLTLDPRVQEAVEEGLRNSPSGRGAVVALDPRDGSILALASVPDYDPNLFLLPEWGGAKSELTNLPEFNRAISGTYSPGSTFKIIVGAAMLEERRVRPEDRVFCRGWFRLGRRTFRCWQKKGHGWVAWMKGLTHSCDVYFYEMGLRAGGDLIESYARRFRLGAKTGIDLIGEKDGNLFGPEARRARNRGWYDGDTANLSIGQGELLATPIQMAVVIAAVANRGTFWRPYYASKLEYPNGRTVSLDRGEAVGHVALRADTWEALHGALRSVVTDGTGRRVNIPGLAVHGKTGTSQNPLGEDHAWFVAFAGREGEEPSFSVSVLVEHGGHGSSAAGPIARRAIEAAFNLTSARRPPRSRPDQATADRGLPRGSVTERSSEGMPPPDVVGERPASEALGAADRGLPRGNVTEPSGEGMSAPDVVGERPATEAVGTAEGMPPPDIVGERPASEALGAADRGLPRGSAASEALGAADRGLPRGSAASEALGAARGAVELLAESSIQASSPRGGGEPRSGPGPGTASGPIGPLERRARNESPAPDAGRRGVADPETPLIAGEQE
ncbi:MAG: penicillin-binding protein 2 [Elusimicrobiota bacterium]